ncbi:MCP four helix bundle domain-containing protein, partial [Diaphorobacter nitroreducens]|uniref:MCP four helix bundle domain-containing protein n=1 Tax=Diaphorobacter nitroreducens TaxID=164759 RepID=UPI0035AE9A98
MKWLTRLRRASSDCLAGTYPSSGVAVFDFSSWRVRTRLTVGFGVVCVLLVASVLMGLMAMSRMGADLKAVVADHFPRIVASTTILTHTNEIAIALRNMMLTPDAADRERQVQAIAK